MKVLVFGKHGQVARALAETFRESVTFLGREEADLSIPGQGAAAVAASTCDLVINAAAFTSVDQAETEQEANVRLNAKAPGEIARAAAAAGVPIIHLSTDYVFDGSMLGAWREDDPTGPLGAYGRAKLAGEQAVASANARHIIIRTAWVISPWGRNFVRSIIDAATRNDELRVVADQNGSPTSAIDLARGIRAAAAALANSDRQWGIYHLAGQGTASWHELAVATMEEAAANGLRSVPVRPISTADWPTAAERPKNSVLDSTKFERSFDYRTPEWQPSLASIVSRIAADSREGRPA